MGYRDELGAAEARIRALEDELELARAEITRLRAPASIEVAPARADAGPLAPRPATRLGYVYYHPPPTYWPALRAYVKLLRAALTGAPAFGRFKPESLLGLTLYYGVFAPFVVVAWPLYWLSMAGILTLAGALAAALTVGALPLLVLSRLRFSGTPLPPASELARGDLTDEAARAVLWSFASVLLVPMAFSWRLLREGD